MGQKVYVVGVGMIKFEKPGKRDWDYPKMGSVAAKKALASAGIKYDAIEHAVCGYVYGDSTCGQRAIYEVGLSGIPVYNVNNNCSTGSTALLQAKQLIEGGLADCVLALGFEKMERGSLQAKWTDRTNPLDMHMNAMMKTREVSNAPFAPQMFGNAGREHMEKYQTKKEHFAMIAEKNRRHSLLNPYAQFRQAMSTEQILKSRPVYEPLTLLQCCPTSEGAAAAVLCSEAFVKRHGLQAQAVEIAGMALATDKASSFEGSCIQMVGADMTRRAKEQALRQAGVDIPDVQVVELHDCFSCNELVTYEALGLCGEGEAPKYIERNAFTYGGEKAVVNPSGGLISKGHPLGATGLAQCAELYWQLMHMCGKRQVPNAEVALQHNIGLGGAAVVAVYRHGFPEARRPLPQGAFNPAIDENTDFVPGEDDRQQPQQQASAPAASAGSSGFASDPVFKEIGTRVQADAGMAKKLGGIFAFKIIGEGGKTKDWTLDFTASPATVQAQGPSGKADITITVKDADFVALAQGKKNPQQLFMGGDLKISGNMGKAMQLGTLFKSASKL